MTNRSIRSLLAFVVGGILLIGLFVLIALPSYTHPLGLTPEAAAHLPYVRNNGEPSDPEPTPTSVPAGAYLETHDGDPASPIPWHGDGWSLTVHSRDRETWSSLQEMAAGHGTDCAGPPASHLITAYEDAVYQCKNHVMSAIYASGYGLIYRTPNHMVDFSQGEAVINFDMSTLRTSGRDWIDIYISPYEDNLQLALIDWLPDLSGDPKRGINIQMEIYNEGNGLGMFKAFVINNFSVSQLSTADFTPYDDFLEPSPTRRDTFEIRISQNHLTFGMPDYDVWWIDTDIPALDWNQGVVQFGHHSYNPKKACNHDGTCWPNTWHWDNILINPAVPFTIIQSDRRFVDEDDTTINLSAPAPANAHLRFAGIGDLIEVSFDGGQSWEEAQVKEQERYLAENFWSYWTPIPEGTTSVKFRGDDWWGGGWHVRDITVWSLETNGQSSNFVSSSRDDYRALLNSVEKEPAYCIVPDVG